MLVASNEESDRLLDMPACLDALAAVYADWLRGEASCFVNNVGLGIQFVGLAVLVHEKARASGAGGELPAEWFTQDVHP